MRTTDSIASIAPALAKAQSEIEDPTMTGKGQVGGGKSAARIYEYALLIDVLVVARKALGGNGIFFTQSSSFLAIFSQNFSGSLIDSS